MRGSLRVTRVTVTLWYSHHVMRWVASYKETSLLFFLYLKKSMGVMYAARVRGTSAFGGPSEPGLPMPRAEVGGDSHRSSVLTLLWLVTHL